MMTVNEDVSENVSPLALQTGAMEPRDHAGEKKRLAYINLSISKIERVEPSPLPLLPL
jgi:hypothetical protein